MKVRDEHGLLRAEGVSGGVSDSEESVNVPTIPAGQPTPARRRSPAASGSCSNSATNSTRSVLATSSIASAISRSRSAPEQGPAPELGEGRLLAGVAPELVVDARPFSSRRDQARRQLTHLADDGGHEARRFAAAEPVRLRHDVLDGVVDVAADPDGEQGARQNDPRPTPSTVQSGRVAVASTAAADAARLVVQPNRGERLKATYAGMPSFPDLAEDAARVGPRPRREARGHRFPGVLRGARSRRDGLLPVHQEQGPVFGDPLTREDPGRARRRRCRRI